MTAHYMGDLSVRPRRTPTINSRASNLLELIDWSGGLHEPPLTCNSTTAEVKKFVDEPMQVLPWPCHAQSIEGRVKKVTEAAGKVYTQEKRKGCIRGQDESHRLMAKNDSKQDLG